MSSRFFGEYLIFKGVITPEVLVEALNEQMSGLPLVSQVVFDNKLLPSDTIVKVFHIQQDRGIDFASACKTIDVWNEKIAREVDDYLKKLRIPLGQILVKMGALDLKTLTRSLDDFLAQAEVYVAATMEAPIIKASAPENHIDESSFSPDTMLELEDMFDERKKKALKVALGFFRDGSVTDPGQMTKLFQDCLKTVRTLIGFSDLLKLDSLKIILVEMETTLSLRLNGSAFSAQEMHDAAVLLADALEEAWALRSSLINHKNDKFYFGDPVHKDKYESVIQNMRGLK